MNIRSKHIERKYSNFKGRRCSMKTIKKWKKDVDSATQELIGQLSKKVWNELRDKE